MKPLTYSQYRIEQALHLQAWYAKRKTEPGSTTDETFYLEKYIDYLKLCGVNQEILCNMGKFLPKLNYMSYSFSGTGKMYSRKIAGNIIPLIDLYYKKYIEPNYEKK